MEIEKKSVGANFDIWQKYKEFLKNRTSENFFQPETKTNYTYVLWYYYSRLAKFVNSNPSPESVDRFNHVFPSLLASISDLKVHRIFGNDIISQAEEEIPQETKNRNEKEKQEEKKNEYEKDTRTMLTGLQPGDSRKYVEGEKMKLSKKYLTSGLIPGNLVKNFLNTKWINDKDTKEQSTQASIRKKMKTTGTDMADFIKDRTSNILSKFSEYSPASASLSKKIGSSSDVDSSSEKSKRGSTSGEQIRKITDRHINALDNYYSEQAKKTFKENALLQTYAPSLETIKKEVIGATPKVIKGTRSRRRQKKEEGELLNKDEVTHEVPKDISEIADKEGEGIEKEDSENYLTPEEAINFGFHYLQHLKHDHLPIYHEANEAFHSSIRKGGAIGNLSASVMHPLLQYPLEYIRNILQEQKPNYMYTDDQYFNGAPTQRKIYGHHMLFREPSFINKRQDEKPSYMYTDDQYFNGAPTQRKIYGHYMLNKDPLSYIPNNPESSFRAPRKRKATVVPPIDSYPPPQDLPSVSYGIDQPFKNPPIPVNPTEVIRSAIPSDAQDPNVSLLKLPVNHLQTIMGMADRFGLLPGYLTKLLQSGALTAANNFLPQIGYDHSKGTMILPNVGNLGENLSGFINEASNRISSNEFIKANIPSPARNLFSKALEMIPGNWLPVLLNALTAGAGAYYFGAPLFNFGRQLLSSRGNGPPNIPAGISRGLTRFALPPINEHMTNPFSALTNEELFARRRIQEIALRNPLLSNQIKREYPGLIEAESPNVPQRLLLPQKPLTPMQISIKNMLLERNYRPFDNNIDTPYVTSSSGRTIDIPYLIGVLDGSKRGPIAQQYLEEFKPILKDFSRTQWKKIPELKTLDIPQKYFSDGGLIKGILTGDNRELGETPPVESAEKFAGDLIPGDGISHAPIESHPIHPFQRDLNDIVHEMPIGTYIKGRKSINYQYDRSPHIFNERIFTFHPRSDDFVVRFHRPHIIGKNVRSKEVGF